MRGDSGVAGEGDLELLVYQSFIPGVSAPCMPLMNINSDWMSNAFSDLCIILCYLYYIILFTRVL